MSDYEEIVRARIEDNFGGMGGDVSLFFFRRVNGKVSHRAQAIQFDPVESRHAPMPPTARIYRDQAQQLMDDLWQCGLRPSEGTGSAGALAAVQSHLADFRTIAFKLLKIES